MDLFGAMGQLWRQLLPLRDVAPFVMGESPSLVQERYQMLEVHCG